MVRITEEQWVDYYGFQRFPFDRPEAGNEEFAQPEFLASCFVEPQNFGRLMGQADSPSSAFLFANRGAGKTTCRVMLDYYCRNGQVPARQPRSNSTTGYVLSVPHLDIYQVVATAKSNHQGSILVEYHVIEIIRRAIPSFLETVAQTPDLRNRFSELGISDKLFLSWLVQQYAPYLSVPQVDYLRRQGFFSGIDEVANITGFVSLQNEKLNSKQLHLIMSNWENSSPIDHLQMFTEWVRKIGIISTYILVDGVDEFEGAAENPLFAYRVIRPMCTNLRLMSGIPYLAIKYFLPDSIQAYLMQDRAFRKDRGFIVEKIGITEGTLIKILRKRLFALIREEVRDSDRVEVSFDAFCVPELRGTIEHELAAKAQGNPRSLFLLCGLMISTHCLSEISEKDDLFQLSRKDYNQALEMFFSRVQENIVVADPVMKKIDIQALMQEKEGEHLEFKSSFRWDYRQNIVNKALHLVLSKAVAGMMNRSGGVILLGVDDNGTPLGIEPDIRTLDKNKQNEDGYQLAIQNVIQSFLGMEALLYLEICFGKVENKLICAINVKSSPNPVFLSIEDTNKFFVRIGNITKEMGAKETWNYIDMHWGKEK